MKRKIIVNADDYGRTRGVSSGIRVAHQNGIVTSTTAMMNLPGVESDLEKALLECPHLGLGVHLVLTSGKPLLPSSQVSTVTGGKDPFPSPIQFITLMPEMDPNQVRAEWEAQIQKFIRITGKKPDHLDSHHHTSYFSEPLFQIMLELATDLGCGIRPPLAEGGSDLPLDLPAELGNQSMDFIFALLKKYNPRRPDDFFSSFFGKDATSENLLKILSCLPPGTSEVMCHPGYSDQELMQGSSYNLNREVELAVLLDPLIKNFIWEDDIQPITYAQLEGF